MTAGRKGFVVVVGGMRSEVGEEALDWDCGRGSRAVEERKHGIFQQSQR